ncbi:hypothetical protein C8F01DRAFT_1266953 [Mycena amicta]|nr:hypothetical protein C8F01DRAFT_1266953 [Mycena amicta]
MFLRTLLPVSSIDDKPASIGLSPANVTAIRHQPFVTVVDLGLAVNETFASIPKDVSWIQLLLIAAEFAQDGQWEDVGYLAYQIYVLVCSAQLNSADLVSLVSLLDIPFTDLLWIPVLLVTLELPLPSHSSPKGPPSFMALGGVLVTTLPHLACIVVGFAVPIIIDHILRQGRKIDRFLDRVVHTVLDIGHQSVVSVIHSRHWAIVCRVAYKVFCLLRAFSPTVESMLTAFGVPAAELIWIMALLFALDSTGRSA